MWDYSRSAMNGSPGIFTHVSFRKDKSDCFPQVEMVEDVERNGYCFSDGVGRIAPSLALELIRNAYMNGEVIRLDGAIRMQPR